MSSDVISRLSNKVTHHHRAAVLPSAGSALHVVNRTTPHPGPYEVLVEVKTIAFNPIDWMQRDTGFNIEHYPAVLGSDVGGLVLAVGSSVPEDTPKPGTRVAAFAPCFFQKGKADYGAFQEKVLVSAASITPVPHSMGYNEASMLPMAVGTAWSGFYSIGVPRDTAYTPADKQGILVWGGASSVGSAVVQVARIMGFTVYATASEAHHTYLKKLGATKVFDYKSPNVVENIVKAAKDDGVSIRTGYDAVGQLQSCVDVLKEFKSEGELKLASAPPLSENSPKLDGGMVKFVAASEDEKERQEFFHYVFGVWLKEKLATGEFVPSPGIKTSIGGFDKIQAKLDELKQGVSGVKLVLEVGINPFN